MRGRGSLSNIHVVKHRGCESMIVNSPEYMKIRETLNGFAVFDACSESEMAELLRSSYTRKVPRGKHLYEAGENARDVYLLLDGGVKLCSEVPRQRPKVLQLVYPLELFGMFDVLTDSDRDLSAIAMSASEALVIDGEAFKTLLNNNARFAVSILRGWGTRFREFASWCFRFNHYGAREKVAAYLIEEFSVSGKTGNRAVVPTRRDIASLLGITPETLSRELSYFRKRGWVSVDQKGALRVSDTESLGVLLGA
ncbi:MAG: Crp/Fnr family transcriptional regulator [Proteobacteria bacterium]|nr:MAG: Crp/Fnr family transcriptional regulator [Pseudomonadota bacterium]